MSARAMTAMYVRLGFSANASSKSVGDQGMDDLEELGLLLDKEVDILVKVVKTPGGSAVGELVSMRANTNLKLACFSFATRFVRLECVRQPQLPLPSSEPFVHCGPMKWRT